MTSRNEPERYKMSESMSWRGLSILLLVTGILVIMFANAHLVYVAISSQPACVDHLKTMNGSSSAYRAAKSAC